MNEFNLTLGQAIDAAIAGKEIESNDSNYTYIFHENELVEKESKEVVSIAGFSFLKFRIKHRDPEMKYEGLKQKYIVTRTDGKDITGQDFFCMRLDASGVHGFACRTAIILYAQLIKKQNPVLARDLRTSVQHYEKIKGES